MDKAHYIIFHPENRRQQITVEATAMVDGTVRKNWKGDIFVDQICYGKGNEDPFVFNDPWLYSYCHASQLRRNPRRDNNHLQPGSKIFFVSGQKADIKILTIDTVFLIGCVQKWNREHGLQLPFKYDQHFQNNQSNLWSRHFKFPFDGCHASVSHTYEADFWNENKTDYSFLPLDINRERVSFSFDELPNNLREKIEKKVKGKYPVLLTENEMNDISVLVEKRVITKVLSDIKSKEIGTPKKGIC